MRYRLPLLLSVLFCLAAPVLGALDRRPVYDRTFFEPSEQVVTPHIAWAKPNAAGPVRVLFITHRNAMREVIEIAQRLEMKYTVFAAETPTKFGETGLGVDAAWRLIKGNSAEELRADLLKKLEKEYDVIVVANFQWDLLPIEARYEILKKVKAGTGLAGLITGRDEFLGKLLPDASLAWNWAVWSGAAEGISDYFGKGVFTGGVDYETRRSGEGSVRITCTEAVRGSRESPRAGYSQTNIPVEKNTRYRFSVWYRTRGARGTSISFHPLGGLTLEASDEWKQATAVIDTKDHDRFNVYLLAYHVGDVWYDDAHLVKEGGDGTNLLKGPELEKPRGAAEEPFLTRGVPYAALPAFARMTSAREFGESVLQTGQFRRGRLCVLRGFTPPRNQGMTPGLSGSALTASSLDYDYYLSLAIRAILWAAGKVPAVQIEAPDAPRTVLQRESGGRVPFALSADGPQTGLSARFALRARDGHVWDAREEKLTVSGRTSLEYPMPRVPAGDYFVDLWVKRGGKTVNWASAAVTIEAADRLSEAKIPESIAIGEPVAGQVRVTLKTPGAKQLRLRQFDNYGRLVAERVLPVPAGGGEVAFSLPAPRPVSLLQHLEIALLSAGEPVESVRLPFSYRDFSPPRDDIRWVMWDGMAGDSYIGRIIAREFRKAGLDSQYTGLSEWAIRENMWHIPYVTRFVDRKTDWYQEKRTRAPDDLVRDPCLTDPAYRAKLREDLLQAVQRVTRFGTSEFSLGDENHFVAGNFDLCMSPTCLADFREWARREYRGDLGALNKEYGTAYTSWEQVRPATLEEARKSGNYAPWVDHRRHMEMVWAGIHQYARDVIREAVPGARVGYEGSDTRAGAYHAADYWQIMRAMDLNNLYYRDFQGAAVRDFADPGTLYGAGWYGGYANNRNEEFMRWYPWMVLFQGTNSYWVWMGCGSAGAVMAFDASLYPFFAANAEEMREIKGGVGKLLMHAERQHDGVAVYWSPASVHVREFTPGMPEADDALNATVRVLDDVQVQPRVLSYAELEKLSPQRFKLLFLLQAQALSDAEAEAIRRFVREGGTVVADLRPGVRNEHGTARAAGALDDLFGVKQNAAAPDLKRAEPELLEPARKLPPAVVDASLRVAGGRASGRAGETPVVIRNAFGKGQAILLNLSWADYLARERTAKSAGADYAFWPINEEWRALVRALCEDAGIVPAVSMAPSLPRTQVVRFRSGNAEYVGVLAGLPRDPNAYTAKEAKLPAAQQTTIRFGRTAHAYDVRAGRYLGKVDQVRTPVRAGHARLFALLPYAVSEIRVSTSAVSLGQEARVRTECITAGEKPGRHVLRVRFVGPDGKERREYQQSVVAEEGKAELSLQLALNDAPGTWSVVIRDVATGVTGKAALRVTGSPAGSDWSQKAEGEW